MPLSCFMTTLLLQGFDVAFSPSVNDEDFVETITIAIKKNNVSVQRTINIPKITTNYGLDDLLYGELIKAYYDYNRED